MAVAFWDLCTWDDLTAAERKEIRKHIDPARIDYIERWNDDVHVHLLLEVEGDDN